MGKILTHESIAAGAWNANSCSAMTSQSAWQTELTNTQATLLLTLERMKRDWASCNAKMRKPYGLKEVDP